MFLELLGLGKKSEQRITESLAELFWELYSVIWVEELPNRNCFGINLVISFCVMVMRNKRNKNKANANSKEEPQKPELGLFARILGYGHAKS